jgi:hypothetical protein
VQITTELGCDILRLLREKGHTLLLTPPRCSTWQPIELYWASVKNDVARQFRQGRSLQETKNQLQASLTKWGTAEHCSKLIAHTTKLVKTWWDSARRCSVKLLNKAWRHTSLLPRPHFTRPYHHTGSNQASVIFHSQTLLTFGSLSESRFELPVSRL